MTEKWLEQQLMYRIRLMGGWAVKFWPYSVAGFPDRLVLMPGGRMAFVELKNPEAKPKPKPHQVRVINKLIGLGFQVDVIDSEEKIEIFLNKFEHAV